MIATASRTEEVARKVLALNGERHPHPALLADTMNEVDYAGPDAVQESLPLMPEYTVAKNVYDVPCLHPMCETFHKDLPDWHEWTRTEWVILENGERTGQAGPIDPFERKRDAQDYLRRRGLA